MGRDESRDFWGMKRIYGIKMKGLILYAANSKPCLPGVVVPAYILVIKMYVPKPGMTAVVFRSAPEIGIFPHADKCSISIPVTPWEG